MPLYSAFNSKSFLSRLKSKISRLVFGAPAPIYYLESYSQEGEDLVLNRIFDSKFSGFYVDVGAHHPKRFSNTYFFYQRGWRGINIDAMPNSMIIFNQERPFDINLEIAIMGRQGRATYYQFNEPALNGFSETISLGRDGLREYKIIERTAISGMPLSDVLDRHMPPNTSIDFLTIDVEGLDFDVLKSNNWDRFRPKVILIEILISNLDSLSSDPISTYLLGMNYRLYAKTLNTVFFISNEFLADELC
jgi:FkbM family methyltransferase